MFEGLVEWVAHGGSFLFGGGGRRGHARGLGIGRGRGCGLDGGRLRSGLRGELCGHGCLRRYHGGSLLRDRSRGRGRGEGYRLGERRTDVVDAGGEVRRVPLAGVQSDRFGGEEQGRLVHGRDALLQSVGDLVPAQRRRDRLRLGGVDAVLGAEDVDLGGALVPGDHARGVRGNGAERVGPGGALDSEGRAALLEADADVVVALLQVVAPVLGHQVVVLQAGVRDPGSDAVDVGQVHDGAPRGVDRLEGAFDAPGQHRRHVVCCPELALLVGDAEGLDGAEPVVLGVPEGGRDGAPALLRLQGGGQVRAEGDLGDPAVTDLAGALGDVGVLVDEGDEVVDAVLFRADGLVCGEHRVGAGRDLLERVVDGGAVGDVEVEAVGLLAAGEAGVGGLAGHALVAEDVAGVGGEALGAADGAGVAELDVLAHVPGGQRDRCGVVAVDDVEGSVGADAGDLPEVAVLDPVSAVLDPQQRLIAAGGDDVADVRGEVVAELHRAGAGDGAGGDAVGLRARVELGDGGTGRREHERAETCIGVGLPAGEHGVGHPVDVAADDATVRLVPGERIPGP